LGIHKIPDFVLKYIIKNKDKLYSNLKISLNLYPEKDYYYDKIKLSFGDMLNLLNKTKEEDIIKIFSSNWLFRLF